jgi:hypothetical protein
MKCANYPTTMKCANYPTTTTCKHNVFAPAQHAVTCPTCRLA